MTNLPNSFTPLINAVENHLISGSGVYPYTVSSSYYSLNWFYENRSQEGLSQDTLTKPQLKVKINSFQDANAWFKPNTKTMYDVEIGIDMAYHLDSKVLKNKRSQLETLVPNDAILIQRCLCNPSTMLTSSLGPTGLCSGRLKFDRYTNVKYDYQNSVATAQVIFTGKVVLTNSYV